MAGFNLDISNPYASGFERALGGPGVGGHIGESWFEAFGNDLAAPAGTIVRAVFDAKVTKVDRTHLDATTGPLYGAGIFLRATSAGLEPDAPDGAGCFYTHVTLAPAIAEGALVARGDDIGEVIEVSGIAPHLHLAIAERRAGTNFGIDIFEHMIATANTTGATRLTFFADGRPPEIGVPPSMQITTGAALADAVEAEGWDVSAALLAQIRALP